MKEIFISIIMPAYDSEKTLPKAVMCILDSDYNNFEIIIVDDASRERVETCIKPDPKIKIIRNNFNKGPACSRNLGADHSRGDILFFIDTDVYIKKDTLSRVNKNFEKRKSDAVVGIYSPKSLYTDFFTNYYNLRLINGLLIRPEISDVGFAAAMAVRKDIFMQMGGFDTKYKRASVEDIELGRRLFMRGHRVRLDKELSVDHDKRMTFKSMIANDFARAADRVEFILSSKDIKDVFKKGRFEQSSIGKLFSIILVPFFWISVMAGFFNARFFLISGILLPVFACLNRGQLLYNYNIYFL